MNQIPTPPIILSDILCNTLSTSDLFTAVYATNIVTSEFMETAVINNGSLQIVDDKFNNVGTVNGVVVQSHGSRHGFNDADPLIVGVTQDIKDISFIGSYGGVSNKIPRADHVHAHGNLLGEDLHSVVTFGSAGFMSSADKNKLDGLLPISNPVEVGYVSSAGFLNSFSRSDHVHFHGYFTGDSSYHAIATESLNGYMASTDFQLVSAFSLDQSGIMSLSDKFSVLSQPFGTVDSNSNQTVPNATYTLLSSYWGGSSSLTSINFSNGIYTILYSGYYTILANPLISGNTNGNRSGYISINGDYVGKTVLHYNTITTITPTLWLQSIEYLNVGDTVSIYVYQLSGTSATMSATNISQFTICKLL
jgi:hypothetical protein